MGNDRDTPRVQPPKRVLGVQIPPLPPLPADEPQTSAPKSIHAETDKAIGKGVRLLLERLVTVAVTAALATGATMVLHPSASPQQVERTEVRTDANSQQMTELREELKREKRWRAKFEPAMRCRLDQAADALAKAGVKLTWSNGETEFAEDYMPGRTVKARPMIRALDECPPFE